MFSNNLKTKNYLKMKYIYKILFDVEYSSMKAENHSLIIFKQILSYDKNIHFEDISSLIDAIYGSVILVI